MDAEKLESDLRAIARKTPRVMAALIAARRLALPDWAIGAGFIRAAVWDELCGMGPSAVDDVDLLYYDPSDLSWAPEERAEATLHALQQDLPWSARNQARMHLRKGRAQFASTIDAMRFWLETPTCVALRLEKDDHLTVLAPYGLGDLFARKIRPTPSGRQYPDEYMTRVKSKQWEHRWPGIEVERL